jgi:hypothetical protein
MDIGLNDRAVDAQLATVFQPYRNCCLYQFAGRIAGRRHCCLNASMISSTRAILFAWSMRSSMRSI